MARILGLIGGLGPESTVDYYQRLIARYRELAPGRGYPRILINSVDLEPLLAMVDAKRYDDLAEALGLELERLARAGAEIAALTANTPHLVFDALAARSPVPLVSIVEATRDAARARGLERVGLIGTRFTMEAAFYPDAFEAAGIAVAIPEPDDRAWVHSIYFTELVPGVFKPETRAGLLAVIGRMRARERIEGVILGGTELPLILRGDEEREAGIPFLDTTRIHVEALVDRLLA